MSKLALEQAIISLTPTADQSGSRGYFVENSSGNAAIVNAATDVALGVITDGGTTSQKSSIAMCGSGLVAKVKLAATPGSVVLGSYLTLDGTTLGAVALDPGTGARVRVARALESGAANELIDAVLIDATVLS